ncbi:hypothetical protein ACWGB8_20145 [Kitasatospora sp. NPDC054939]
MALFRKPGRGEPDEPTPELVAEELAELVEELEKPVAGPSTGQPPAGPARTAPDDRTAPERAAPEGAPPARTGEAEWKVAEYGGERGRRRGAVLVAQVSRMLGEGGRAAAKGAATGGRVLTDRLLQAAPRIPVRNLATLRAQHPEALDSEALAEVLVTGAARASAALGAGVGAAAMLPVPPAMPVEIAAETLAVAAVEIKLIAELHEVYGQPATGTVPDRAAAYVTAWANRRGVDRTVLAKPAGLAAMALGAEVRGRVRKRLTRSTLRRLPSLTPLLVGAGIGATVNRRDTLKLAKEVRDDLRPRRPVDPAYWLAAAPGARPPLPDGQRPALGGGPGA